MDEYTALAQQVAVGDGDIRACLILSRDGMLLGAFPTGDEVETKLAWLRFSALGEPQKGFIEFPDRIWAYVHRGPYAAFAVASPSARPGLLMDRLEQALFVAEDARTRHEPLKLGESGAAPSGKPRTPLHPPAVEPAQAPRVEVPVMATSDPILVEDPEVEDPEPSASGPPPSETSSAGSTAPSSTEPAEPSSPEPGEPETPPATGVTPISNLRREPQRLVTSDEARDDEAEVDRVLLAKEFSGLLQMDDNPDDAGS